VCAFFIEARGGIFNDFISTLILFYKRLQKYILEKDSDHQLINFPDKISWKVILTLKIVEFNKFTSKKNYNFKKIEKFNKIFFL
jgi:hypothetical protein